VLIYNNFSHCKELNHDITVFNGIKVSVSKKKCLQEYEITAVQYKCILGSVLFDVFRFQVVRWTKTARNSGLTGIKKPNRYLLLSNKMINLLQFVSKLKHAKVKCEKSA